MKVSFEITACINLPTQVILGSYIHPQVNTIQILQTEINKWRAKYKVVISLPASENNERVADISEEVRNRLVAIFTVASRVDVSATDELLIESQDSSVAINRRGDRRDLQKLATPMRVTFLDARIANCSELEWNALKRLKQAFLSTSFADKFEAFAGTIDVLGKNDFPQFSRQVQKRMSAYLEQRLCVAHDVAQRIVNARHNKIHENAIDQTLKSDFYALIHQVADNLCARFYLPIKVNAISRIFTDEFQVVHAPEKRQPSTSKVGRNEPCPCKSGKKFKKCCGA